ncbi:MAG: alpha-hydroxyketone-type quorum-sensing autoinducer synthase [Betaproteobacteria bacterium]|jgi:CAI-1 autoinducer synthase
MFEAQELQHRPKPSVQRPADPPLTDRLWRRIEGDFLQRFTNEWGGRAIVHGRPAGPDAIHLDGNDYLGLSGNPEIVNAIVQALKMDASFAIQSSAFLLDEHPARRLEKSLACWLGKQDAMLCQSGYAANVGLLQAITDQDTPVYVDSLAHMSLWEGAHTARAPAQPFRHNDPDHLERLLASGGPGVVVVDAVYSTSGELCPLAEIVDVVERYGSMVVVDESHSLGTHGLGGRGLCSALGLASRVHFITASLAKAFAGRAGFFTVPHGLRNFMLLQSYPNIFSSCLLPHEVEGLSATLSLVQRADQQRLRLRANVRRLRDTLDKLGYPLAGSEQIISLVAGTESDAIKLRDTLEDHNIFGAIFCAPATSRKRAMVRLTVSAALTDSEIDRVIEVAREIAPQVKPWTWPAARRAAVRSAAAA